MGKENKKFLVEFDEHKMNDMEELIKWISDLFKHFTTRNLQAFIRYLGLEEKEKNGDGKKDTNLKFYLNV